MPSCACACDSRLVRQDWLSTVWLQRQPPVRGLTALPISSGGLLGLAATCAAKLQSSSTTTGSCWSVLDMTGRPGAMIKCYHQLEAAAWASHRSCPRLRGCQLRSPAGYMCRECTCQSRIGEGYGGAEQLWRQCHADCHLASWNAKAHWMPNWGCSRRRL